MMRVGGAHATCVLVECLSQPRRAMERQAHTECHCSPLWQIESTFADRHYIVKLHTWHLGPLLSFIHIVLRFRLVRLFLEWRTLWWLTFGALICCA